MDDQRFDALARRFATIGVSRRHLLCGVIGGMGVGMLNRISRDDVAAKSPTVSWPFMAGAGEQWAIKTSYGVGDHNMTDGSYYGLDFAICTGEIDQSTGTCSAIDLSATYGASVYAPVSGTVEWGDDRCFSVAFNIDGDPDHRIVLAHVDKDPSLPGTSWKTLQAWTGKNKKPYHVKQGELIGRVSSGCCCLKGNVCPADCPGIIGDHIHMHIYQWSGSDGNRTAVPFADNWSIGGCDFSTDISHYEELVPCAASRSSKCTSGTWCKGKCVAECTGGQVLNATCQCACPSGTALCGGSCVQLGTSTNCLHCGDACGTTNPCAVSLCDPIKGCYESPVLDGTACTFNGTDGTCQNGSCEPVACPSSEPTNCNGTCADLNFDSDNCGTCGTRCRDSEGRVIPCLNGQCCPDGATTVCANTGTAVCVDIFHDPSNCGGCGNVCGTTNPCEVPLCDPSNGCQEQPVLDGTACILDGVEGTCQGGQCVAPLADTCAAGEDYCRDGLAHCNGRNDCYCFTTTSGATFCGAGGRCWDICVNDDDCTAITGPGSACIITGGVGGFCNDNCATACQPPCAALPTAAVTEESEEGRNP